MYVTRTSAVIREPLDPGIVYIAKSLSKCYFMNVTLLIIKAPHFLSIL